MTARKWWLLYAAKWLVLILAIIAWSLAMVRVGQKKALKTYEAWYATERLEIDKRSTDPEAMQFNREAEMIAQVLYGVKDNDTDDLRTMCWCVFNRCDNPQFPNTLEEVISQPNQWMRYDPENPVIENLYQVAREQLDMWQSEGHRPCMNTFVFMDWSANDICLRDTWMTGNTTRYWRYA